MSAPIPPGVAALVDCSQDCEVSHLDDYRCTLLWHGIEIRLVTLFSGEWELDEVVGDCFIHLEQMDDPYYWIGLTPKDGYDGTLHLDLIAKARPRRIRLTARCD